jgi:hypothetical protein
MIRLGGGNLTRSGGEMFMRVNAKAGIPTKMATTS